MSRTVHRGRARSASLILCGVLAGRWMCASSSADDRATDWARVTRTWAWAQRVAERVGDVDLSRRSDKLAAGRVLAHGPIGGPVVAEADLPPIVDGQPIVAVGGWLIDVGGRRYVRPEEK